MFASKSVGFALASYLLETGAPVNRLVVGRAEDNELIDLAERYDTPFSLYTGETQERLADEGRRYGWLLNLWSPHILLPAVLALADHRLNVHPSLVPHCQGNDNAAWALRKKLRAGISLIEMGKKIDAGEVYVQKEIRCEFPTRGGDLHKRLIRESVSLFKEHWQDIYHGRIVPRRQEGPVSYHTRKETERDRLRDASETMTLEDFTRWLLAHDFSPNTTAEMKMGNSIYRMRLVIERKQ